MSRAGVTDPPGQDLELASLRQALHEARQATHAAKALGCWPGDSHQLEQTFKEGL